MIAMEEAVKLQPALGDFYVESWGYDQTNVTFYRVVGITPSGKSVRLVPWPSALVESTNFGGDYVVPADPDAPSYGSGATQHYIETGERPTIAEDVEHNAEVTLHRLRPDSRWIRVRDWSAAELWDGKPEYRTAAGWGH